MDKVSLQTLTEVAMASPPCRRSPSSAGPFMSSSMAQNFRGEFGNDGRGATMNTLVSKAIEMPRLLRWRSDSQVVLRTSRDSGFVHQWKTSSKVEAIVVLCCEKSLSNRNPANVGEVEEEGLGSRESSAPTSLLPTLGRGRSSLTAHGKPSPQHGWCIGGNTARPRIHLNPCWH